MVSITFKGAIHHHDLVYKSRKLYRLIGTMELTANIRV